MRNETTKNIMHFYCINFLKLTLLLFVMEISSDWMIADLHIHSRFSRACSKDLNFENFFESFNTFF